jgi:hypothetical protein
VPRRAGCVDEFGRERLHPPIDRDVIDLAPTFGEQLLLEQTIQTSN